MQRTRRGGKLLKGEIWRAFNGCCYAVLTTAAVPHQASLLPPGGPYHDPNIRGGDKEPGGGGHKVPCFEQYARLSNSAILFGTRNKAAGGRRDINRKPGDGEFGNIAADGREDEV